MLGFGKNFVFKVFMENNFKTIDKNRNCLMIINSSYRVNMFWKFYGV